MGALDASSETRARLKNSNRGCALSFPEDLRGSSPVELPLDDELEVDGVAS